MILVSACLCGINCRYDGDTNADEKVIKLWKEGKAIMVCPEQLGGLTTPRPPKEIIDGSGKDVLDGNGKVVGKEDGDDATYQFLRGAEEALRIAKELNIKTAILKAKSPSCGKGIIYDGTFSGVKKEGNGVTAELLIRNGIAVYTENEIEDFLAKSNI